MSKARRNHSPGFKAKVALAALTGLKTLTELSEEYGVHPQVISKWKRILEKEAKEIFSGSIKKSDQDGEKKMAELYRQIGQQKVELDWIKKKAGFDP